MEPNEPPMPEQNQDPNPPAAPPIAADPPVDDVAAANLARRTCPVCGRVFDSPKAMWGHSWVHRNQRDQIYAMPPPPSAASGGGALGMAGPVGVAVAAEPINRWVPGKIDSRDDRDRTCPRCSRVFGSPKAMFGHLHVHYERSAPRRRRNEPPEAEAEPAEVIEVQDEDELEGVDGAGGDSPVSIDLNLPATDEDNEEVDEEEYFPIDLNKAPPRA